MQERRFVESFNAALEGFIYVMKTERNMRIHYLAALFVVILSICLNFSLLEIAILMVTIILVLASEMINTALELTVDLIKSETHPIARIIKDVSAGAVLLTSINAAIVGYILFSKHVPFNVNTELTQIKRSPWHITFIALIIILSVTIIGKILFHKGTPLRGGMPSGHAAMAFSIWTIIIFLTNNAVVITLTFVMAFLIARQRVKSGIHNFWEVLVGSIIGVLFTTMIFQLFR